MLDSSDENLTRVYSALANPYCRRIVHILKQTGKAGFKDLLDSLRIGVSALYHHLDSLDGLVSLGPDKKYVLTEEGLLAFDTLSVGEGRMSAKPTRGAAESRLATASKEILFGRTLFHYLSQNPLRNLPLSMIVLAMGGFVSFRTNLEPILLFYLNPSPGILQIWFLLLFPLGWFVTFAVTDLLCSLFFHRRGGELSLINGTALSMLPLLLVPGLILLAQPFSAAIQPASSVTILIQVVVQVWVVCLLASATSIAKGLRIERTALVSLAVMYMNISTVIIALQVGLF